MSKKTKILIFSVSALLLLSFMVGITYSLWTANYEQEGPNELTVGCFNVSYTNLNEYGGNSAGDISLINAYPITETAGSAKTPYIFKIKNECEVSASYVINIETLNTSNFNTDYLRVKFNEASNNSGTSSLYKDITTANPTLQNVTSAKQLTTGYLTANEEVTYALRIWIDIDATTETPNVMGATWNGKVVVNSEAMKAKSVSGTRAAYITDGYDAPLKNLEITGNTENNVKVGQNGTMDIVVSGKNLFNYSLLSSVANNGITFTNNNDGSFDVFGQPADSTLKTALDTSINHINSMKMIFQPGNYTISLPKCDGRELDLAKEPHLYLNHYYDNDSNNNMYYLQSIDVGRSTFNFTQEMLSYSDFRLSPGIIVNNGMTVDEDTYCPQIEYGSTATDFEPYKERRYTIQLKDTLNNTISGLSSTDTLKKDDDVWVIDTGSSKIELASATQSVLDTISTYSGVSRIWVDDNVLVTSIKATYVNNN